MLTAAKARVKLVKVLFVLEIAVEKVALLATFRAFRIRIARLVAFGLLARFVATVASVAWVFSLGSQKVILFSLSFICQSLVGVGDLLEFFDVLWCVSRRIRVIFLCHLVVRDLQLLVINRRIDPKKLIVVILLVIS